MQYGYSFCWAVAAGNGIPLRYSCLENPMDGGAWWAAVHGVTKSWTRLSNFTFTLHFHALEKETATHSSVLAWRIPGMGEPSGLPSMGSQSWTRLKQLGGSSSSSSEIFRSEISWCLGHALKWSKKEIGGLNRFGYIWINWMMNIWKFIILFTIFTYIWNFSS